jgi:hypothetical protein
MSGTLVTEIKQCVQRKKKKKIMAFHYARTTRTVLKKHFKAKKQAENGNATA